MEITFFLGAGASCQAMPLVANFKDRFRVFKKLLSQLSSHSPAVKETASLAKEFQNNLETHASFDTIFKKLYHVGLENKTWEYKLLLNLFFLFEHRFSKNVIRNYLQVSTPEDFLNEKKFCYDPRYDALVAGLLKPNRLSNEMIVRTNFISWNYDLCFLQAISNYAAGYNLSNRLIETPKFHDGSYSFLNGTVNYIPLNGTISREKVLIKDWSIQEANPADFLLKECIYFQDQIRSSNIFTRIEFSWENSKEDRILNASQAIGRSTHLVIVGYSFPLYNRTIDSAIFSPPNLEKSKIYIQDMRGNEVRAALVEQTRVNAKSLDLRFPNEYWDVFSSRIQIVSDLSSFYVPYDVTV